MEEIKSEQPKKPLEWSVSKTENGLTTCINVQQIENGYLICTNKYGTVDNKYIDESKKEYSKTNPLEEEEKEEKDETSKLAKGMSGLLDSLASSEGKFNV